MEFFSQKVFVCLFIMVLAAKFTGACIVVENGNYTILCPRNSSIAVFHRDVVGRWNFCCSKSNVSYSGSWHSEHSAFRRSFELDCGTNSFVSGLVTNVSHIWQDRIWSIHCSDTHPTHALVNCSWTIRYGALVDFYVPNSVSVIAAIRSVIIPNTSNRGWFFKVCSQQAYCAPGTQVSLPRGGVASEVNSTLQIVCPSGTYINGPAQLNCSDLQKTTVSKCEICRSIIYCLNTSCSSASFSVCLKCIDHHPIWNIPVVANRRRRKCRVPPVISSSSKHLIFTKGQTIRLPCTVLGIPKPKICWMFDGETLSWGTIDDDGSLFLNKTTLLNSEIDVEGTYTCSAKNVVGSDSIDYSLSEVLMTVLIKEQYSAVEGDEILLVCPVEEFEDIQWLNCSEHRREYQHLGNTDRITLLNNSQVLRINPVHLLDAGVFGCRARYGGISVVASIILHTIASLMDVSGSGLMPLTMPPEMINWTDNYAVSVGDSIVLYCEVSGYPPSVVYWRYEDQILLSGVGRVELKFHNASASSAGVYTCIADSMYYKDVSRRTFLRIQPRPTHTYPTTSILVHRTITLPTRSVLPTNLSAASTLSYFSLPLLLLIAITVSFSL